ncbi:MAG: putative transcriptional regulator, MerR family [Actinomycetia bacterium]|nr:putative transcriptional regulator, MerR family [Actinomycetes bacterium]
MFSIGDFARLGGVSTRTLRYYEELGLLQPVAVDPATGYRSYSAYQLARLNRIVALKDLGLSLGQLQPLLDDLSADQLREMLERKRAELQEQLVDDRARLTRVEQRLQHIEGEDRMPIDVLVKHVPPLRVALVRCEQPGLEFGNMEPAVRPAVTELVQRLSDAGVHFDGPLFLFYDEQDDGTIVPHVAIEVGDQDVPVDAVVREATLPAIDVVSTVHSGGGGHDAIGPIYGQLARWAEDHGYEAKGPGRDIVLEATNEDDAVYELQMPVVKTAG